MADSSSQNTNDSGGGNDSFKSISKELESIRNEIAEYTRPDKDAPIEEQREFKKLMNDFSKRAAALRKKQIAADNSLTDKDKAVLTLYDKGTHVFAIALQVYDFANQDTVGRVMLTIRKAHADDFDEVEDVNSTKGYTGVGVAGHGSGV